MMNAKGADRRMINPPGFDGYVKNWRMFRSSGWRRFYHVDIQEIFPGFKATRKRFVTALFPGVDRQWHLRPCHPGRCPRNSGYRPCGWVGSLNGYQGERNAGI